MFSPINKVIIWQLVPRSVVLPLFTQKSFAPSSHLYGTYGDLSVIASIPA
jgi:hypothetical protein